MNWYVNEDNFNHLRFTAQYYDSFHQGEDRH